MRIFNRRAFTFVEVMLTTFIFVMILGALYAGLIAGGRSWDAFDSQTAIQREARRVYAYLNRDLRMARYLKFKKNTSREVVFSFEHPDEGLVTYAWARPPDKATGPLHRSSPQSSRVLSTRISAFTVEQQSERIDFSLCTATEDQDNQDEFQLTGRVTRR